MFILHCLRFTSLTHLQYQKIYFENLKQTFKLILNKVNSHLCHFFLINIQSQTYSQIDKHMATFPQQKRHLYRHVWMLIQYARTNIDFHFTIRHFNANSSLYELVRVTLHIQSSTFNAAIKRIRKSTFAREKLLLTLFGLRIGKFLNHVQWNGTLSNCLSGCFLSVHHCGKCIRNSFREPQKQLNRLVSCLTLRLLTPYHTSE